MSFKKPASPQGSVPTPGVSRERRRARSTTASVHWRDRQLELTDPKAMRALAHPLRIELLRLLREPRTATECAEALGESPQSCSYHLRTLAKYGFVERAE